MLRQRRRRILEKSITATDNNNNSSSSSSSSSRNTLLTIILIPKKTTHEKSFQKENRETWKQYDFNNMRICFFLPIFFRSSTTIDLARLVTINFGFSFLLLKVVVIDD
jgi:hypothetical protein